MKNFYSEYPVVPYEQTSVTMTEVIPYIQSLAIPVVLKIAIFIVFRNESGNGAKGVNHNYVGLQSDAGRWTEDVDKHVTGTCVKKENKTGKERGFLCFKSWKDSIDILASKLQSRGLYVGGKTHLVTKSYIVKPEDWVNAYYREWVTGNARAIPPAADFKGLLSMYQQGVKLFS